MKYFYSGIGDYLAAVGNWMAGKFIQTIKAEDKTTQLLLMPFIIDAVHHLKDWRLILGNKRTPKVYNARIPKVVS
jgi:hypothetical protein